MSRLNPSGRKRPGQKKPGPYGVFLFLSFASRFLFSLIFTVNLIYHVKVAGLTPLQLILVGTVLEASVFLFEIPTGIVADGISRKHSVVIGYALMGVGFFLEGIYPHFWAIAAAQVVWGTGYTFTSGATQAWIVDEIGEDRAGKAFVRGAQAGQLGELAAIPAGIGVGMIAVNIPILLGGVLMVLLSLFLLLLMEETGFRPNRSESTSGWKTMLGTFMAARNTIRSNHLLLLLLAIGVFYGLYSEGFDRLWTAHLLEDFQSALLENTNSVLLLGVIRGILIVLSYVVLEMVNRLLNFANTKHIIRLLIFGTAVIICSLAGFGLTGNLYTAVLLFWVTGMVRSLISPLQDTWLNSMITDPGTRATMFSVKSQVDSLGQIGGGPLVGVFGNLFSIRTALAVSALLLSPVLLLYGMVLKRQKVNF